MKYYVSILKSLKDEKYYTGSTSNPKKRLEFHNTGKQRSTKNRIPFKMIYSEEFANKTDALRSIKSGETIGNHHRE